MVALVTRPWTHERLQLIRTSRVNAGRAVVQAIEQARVKPPVLVQSSAVGYYGLPGDREITEDTPAGNDALARICVDWEATTASIEVLGVRRVVIRTGGVVMSTQGGALPFMLLPFKLFVGGLAVGFGLLEVIRARIARRVQRSDSCAGWRSKKKFPA